MQSLIQSSSPVADKISKIDISDNSFQITIHHLLPFFVFIIQDFSSSEIILLSKDSEICNFFDIFAILKISPESSFAI